MIRWAIDTETNGVHEGARALSVSVVNIDNGETHTFLLRQEGVAINPDATRVNGLTAEKLEAEGVSRAYVASFVAEIIRNADEIWAHNAQFDVRILRTEFEHYGIQDPFGQCTVRCTGLELRDAMGVTGNFEDGRPRIASLKRCWEALMGPALEDCFNGPTHGAEDDAKSVAELVSAIIDQR
jgi:DNA polymerase III epsilon subunit-like protein